MAALITFSTAKSPVNAQPYNTKCACEYSSSATPSNCVCNEQFKGCFSEIPTTDCCLLPDLYYSEYLGDYLLDNGFITQGMYTAYWADGSYEQNPSNRILLRSTIANIGQCPFYIKGKGVFNPNGSEQVQQMILIKPENGTLYPFLKDLDASIMYHPIHEHLHLQNFIRISLRTNNGSLNPLDWPIIVQNSKIGFCLQDIGTCNNNVGGIADIASFENFGLGGSQACVNANPNISPNCIQSGSLSGVSPGHCDVYSYNYFGQSLPLSGVCNGNYYIVAEVDPLNLFYESDETNNVIYFPITINQPDNNTEFIINTNTNYNWYTERELFIDGTIRIKRPFVINNQTMYFSDKGKIIIEPRGKLTITNSVLKPIVANCTNGTWKGIEVWGKGSNTPQNPALLNTNAVLTPNDPGVLIIKNSTIENAQVGVALYRTDMPNTDDYCGGIVNIKNATFKNNNTAVEFKPYAQNNISTIKNSNFILDQPSIAYNLYFVKMYGTSGVLFDSTAFTATALPLQSYSPVGILSIDADYTVQNNCKFENLTIAIEALASNNVNAPIVIGTTNTSPNLFNNNIFGILLGGYDNVQILGNQFNFTQTQLPNVGIYTQSAVFNIKNNTFTGINNTLHQGIISDNIGPKDNEIKQNTFSNLEAANIAWGENKNLTYRCNTNTNIAYSFAIMQKETINGQIAAYQGNLGNDPTSPASNKFSTCPNPFSHLYTQGNTSPFIYIHHTGAVYKPSCFFDSQLTTTNDANFALQANPTAYNPECFPDDVPNCYPCFDFLQQLSTQIGKLQQKLALQPNSISLQSQLYAAKHQYGLVVNRVLATYLSKHELSSSINLSKAELDKNILPAQQVKRTLIGLYIKVGQYNKATQLLNTLTDTDAETTAFKQLQQIHLNLGQNGKNLFNISLEQENTLQQIAQGPTTSAPNAKSILQLVRNKLYTITTPKIKQVGKTEAEIAKQDLFFTIYPNPASQNTTLTCTLNNSNTTGKLVIYNVLGKLVQQYPVNGNPTTFTLQLPNGLYLAQYVINNVTVQQSKLMVIH